MTPFESSMAGALGPSRLRRDVRLGAYTTFRVGGPADWLIETRNGEEIIAALAVARDAGLPVTILGGGSNVLIADAGIRGLVIRPRGGAAHRVGEHAVRADAALTINGLVRWTIYHRAGGLEAWAGTPGTVGGAIVGNAHFAGQSIGELVVGTRIVARDGTIHELMAAEMAFGYDRSRMQGTGEVLLSADFKVSSGDPAMLRARARESLAYRKRTQPLDAPSAGCIFQNPQPGVDEVPAGIPWSAGALLDRAGLKGARVGGAIVSPTHGNFIVSDGTATAADIRQLIAQCRTAVRTAFGVDLKEEIVYLGDVDRAMTHD